MRERFEGIMLAAGAMVCAALVAHSCSCEPSDMEALARGPRGFSKTITVNNTTTTPLVYASTFPQATGICTVDTSGLNVYVVEETATTTTNGDGPYCDSCSRGARFIVGGFDFARTSASSGTVTCRFYDQPISLGGIGGGVNTVTADATYIRKDGTNTPTTGPIDFGSSLIVDGIAAPSISAAGKAKLYQDSTSKRLRMSLDAGAYSDVVTRADTFTSSAAGVAPASGGGTANFLRADGTFAAPVETFSGSLAVNQVAVGSAANAISGSATLTSTGTLFNVDEAVTVNASMADRDFLISSDTVTDALLVDGTLGNVSLGTNGRIADATIPFNVRRDQDSRIELLLENQSTGASARIDHSTYDGSASTSIGVMGQNFAGSPAGAQLIAKDAYLLMQPRTGGRSVMEATNSAGMVLVTGGVVRETITSAGAASFSGTLGVTGDTTLTADLAVNGGDITTASTGTVTVFNTNATAANILGGATGDVNIAGGSAGTGLTVAGATGNTSMSGDIAVNGGDITTTSTLTSLFSTNATTIGIGAAATQVDINGSSGSTGASFINGDAFFSGQVTGSGLFQNASNESALSLNDTLTTLTSALSMTVQTQNSGNLALTGDNNVVMASANGSTLISSNSTMGLSAESDITVESQANVRIISNNSADVSVSSDNDITATASGNFIVDVNASALIASDTLDVTGTDLSMSSGQYVKIATGTATAPSGDCDAAGETGRAYFETDTGLFSVCNGTTWKTITLLGGMELTAQQHLTDLSVLGGFLRDAMLISLAMVAVLRIRRGK